MREAEVRRDTLETKIRVRLNLDGAGRSALATGIGFFNHMLDQVARHGMIDLDIEAGDTTGHKYGMAFDIGTTSMVATLLTQGTTSKSAQQIATTIDSAGGIIGVDAAMRAKRCTP